MPCGVGMEVDEETRKRIHRHQWLELCDDTFPHEGQDLCANRLDYHESKPKEIKLDRGKIDSGDHPIDLSCQKCGPKGVQL